MFLLAGEILRRTARRLPSKIAIASGSDSVSFAELDDEANRFANALLERGLRKGEVVAIMSGNYPEYAVAYYGAARAGAVLANINARGSAPDVARILERTGARILVVEGSLVPTALDARAKVDRSIAVLIFRAMPPLKADVEALDHVLANASAADPQVELSEDDPLGLTFTGGTTGLPKGVLVSHRARGLSALTTLVDFALAEPDVAAVSTPLFHTAGLYVWYHATVMCGATSVFLPRWDVEGFMATVERQGVTAAVLVPTQINDLVKHSAFRPERLRTLRNINHAGMPMPTALIEHVMKVMPWTALIDNYGTSETGPITARRAEHLPAKAGTVGRPAFNVEVEIRDASGRTLPAGKVGEVVTRGEHLMLGYYKDPQATAAAYRSNDGWFWTGDLGYQDEDGFVVLVDRSKDLLIQGGENIFPVEIEQVLYQHPAVLECAVVGVPDERLGEVPAAHVVLRTGLVASEDDLVAFCLERLARHKRPRRIAFVESLPKSAVGKILKHKIREQYWKDRERRV
jgi:acyl-CoA synthetase (AMP-forming)/AMP-acid ligase II